MKKWIVLALTFLMPLIAWAAPPPTCTVSGSVFDPAGIGIPNGTITFNSLRSQVISGQTVAPIFISTSTDASGVLAPVNLTQLLYAQVTICDQSGTCGAPFGVIVPPVGTVDFGDLAQGTNLVGAIVGSSLFLTGNMTVNGFSTLTGGFTSGPGPATILGSYNGGADRMESVNTTLYYDPYDFGVSFSTAAVNGIFTPGSATITGMTGHDFKAGNGIIAYGAGAPCMVTSTPCASVSIPTPVVSQLQVFPAQVIPATGPFTIVVGDGGATFVTAIDGVIATGSHRPYHLHPTVAAVGNYTESIVAGIATLTFATLDARQSVDIYARTNTTGPGPGTCLIEMAFFPTGGLNHALTQVSAPSSSYACASSGTGTWATVGTAALGVSISWQQLAGTDKAVIYESDNNGANWYIAGEVWQSGVDEHLSKAICTGGGDCHWDQFGQKGSAEDVPATPTGTPAPDAFECTIDSVTATTVHCASGTPTQSGTISVKHRDDPGWAAMFAAMAVTTGPYGRGRAVIPKGKLSRVEQFKPTTQPALIEGSIPDATLGTTGGLGSGLWIFGDGGGPLHLGSNFLLGSTYTGITNNGGITTGVGSPNDFQNMAILYSNSALEAIFNGTSNVGTASFTNVSMDWANGTVTPTFLPNGTQTTGYACGGCLTSEIDRLSIIGVQRDYYTAAGENGVVINGGVWRNVWPGKWFNCEFEYSGTNTGIQIGGITAENPWCMMRPTTELGSINGGSFTPLYNADSGSIANQIVGGTLLELQGTFQVSPGRFDCAAHNTTVGVHIMSHVGSRVEVNNVAFVGCFEGVNSEDSNTTILGGSSSVGTNGFAYSLRGTGNNVIGPVIGLASGATTTTGFSLGYTDDDTNCSGASSGFLSYSSAGNGANTPLRICASSGVKWATMVDGGLVGDITGSGRKSVQATVTGTPTADFSTYGWITHVLTTATNPTYTFTPPAPSTAQNICSTLCVCQPAAGTLDTWTPPTACSSSDVAGCVAWSGGGSAPALTAVLGEGDCYQFCYNQLNLKYTGLQIGAGVNPCPP